MATTAVLDFLAIHVHKDLAEMPVLSMAQACVVVHLVLRMRRSLGREISNVQGGCSKPAAKKSAGKCRAHYMQEYRRVKG